MGVLQEEFKRLTKEVWNAPSILKELLQLVLIKKGHSPTDVQLEALVQAIEAGAHTIELPDEAVGQDIIICDQDMKYASEEFEKSLEGDTEETINRVVEELAPNILKRLYEQLPEALDEWHGIQRDFEDRLCERWKEGLNRLEMLITMAHEAGETYLDDLRNGFAKDELACEPELFDALAALHCRGCRTAREIVCLLKAGYADGALARWRSLHELAVTAFFLVEHRSGDTPERYLAHVVVERWRAAKEYQEHCNVLGYDPYSAAEFSQMEKDSEAAIKKYGASFKDDYGWAAEALAPVRATFTQIERSLKLSHWRPHFRLACQSVHAGSRSLFSSLGISDNAGILLAGASNAGLADPGHLAAISLSMLTTTFLTVMPTIDGLVACNCMLTLCDHIGGEFQQVLDELVEQTDGDK